MIYEIYKKQVEAWKEMGEEVLMIVARRLGNVSWEKTKEAKPNVEKLLLLSRHKDTIELIEAIIKEVEGMIEETAMSPHFPGGQLELRKKFRMETLSDLLTKLQATLTLLKNER